MDADQFYQSRQPEWEALTQLIDKGRRDVSRLSSAEIDELGRLYRAATSDLALAKRDFPRHRLTAYLNQLVARAHALLYRGEPLAVRRIERFVVSGFPRVYRQTLPFTLVATLLFLLAALSSGVAVGVWPETSHWLMPPGMQDLKRSLEDKELWTNVPIEERPYASSFIMQNNIRVAFMAFGSGVLAGLVTVWVVVLNGLILGTLTGLAAYYGVGFELWTFVIGHGVIELSVIMMASGAGLMLGWAVIHPGLLRRRDALTAAARRAVRLVIGCVPLLVIAGLIEGFISPSETIPWGVKWGIGIGAGLLLHSYLLLAGREKRKPARIFVSKV